MKRISISLSTVIAVITLVSPWLVFAQGSLTPPGAPAPTFKTLAQIEPRTPISSVPFTISAAGSYYLTTNLSPAINQNGIVIASDNVTIDLNGFTLFGGGGGSGEGISASGARANIVVRNGTVRNWPGSGVNLYDSGSSQVIVQSIRSISNIFTGIAIKNGSRAVECVASGNGQNGFLVDNDCLVERCKASGNVTAGVAAGATSQLMNNQATANGSGLTITGAGNIVAHNIVKANSDNYNIAQGNQLYLLLCQIPESIDWPAKVKLIGSLTGQAGQNGVTITSGNVTLDLDGFAITGVPGSVRGVYVSGTFTNLTVRNGSVNAWGENGVDAFNGGNPRNLVCERLTVSANGGFGGYLGSSTVVRYCLFQSNAVDGVVCFGGLISDSVALNNKRHGIFAISGEVRNCSASFSGQNGIQATSSDVRDCQVASSGNHGINLTAAGTASGSVSGCSARSSVNSGIFVDAPGCHIIGNNCNGNNTSNGATGGGITINNNDNRIEGNHVTGNLNAGIRVLAGVNNVIIKNTASGNGGNNYPAPPASNDLGPVGNAATATSPWANISN